MILAAKQDAEAQMEAALVAKQDAEAQMAAALAAKQDAEAEAQEAEAKARGGRDGLAYQGLRPDQTGFW